MEPLPLTEVCPFNFQGEEISKRKRKRIQETIDLENKQEKEMREFKAHPLPYGSPEVKIFILLLIIESFCFSSRSILIFFFFFFSS